MLLQPLTFWYRIQNLDSWSLEEQSAHINVGVASCVHLHTDIGHTHKQTHKDIHTQTHVFS